MLRALLLLLALYPALPDEGMLGVEFEPGAVVKRVLPGGPPLQVGDVLVGIAGTPVNGLAQALALCRRPPGTVAPLQVRRGTQVVTCEGRWREIPPEQIVQLEEETRANRRAVPGVVEKVADNMVGIVLEQPVARAFSPGALVGFIPDATVVGEARITRIVTLFRLEAELKTGTVAREWDRVVVTP